MSYVARDGKEFGHPMQGRKYDQWLQQKEKAPGGPQHEHDIRAHGPVREVTIKREGLGRHVLTAKHADGYVHQSVHPEAFRAHQIQAQMLGIDEPPPAVQTHARSRAHPIGPKEEDRIRHEDHAEEK